MWYEAIVLTGKKTGRKIGFPTVNLDPSSINFEIKKGVYGTVVKYNNKKYKGALFYGPRLVKNETKNIIEIYILNFNKEIYGEKISFMVGQFIRKVKKFNTLLDLQKQIQKDIMKV